MKKFFITIIIIIVVFIGILYFYNYKTPYELNVVYKKAISNRSNLSSDLNIEVNNKRLINKSKEVISTILDTTIDENQYKVYIDSIPYMATNVLSISFFNPDTKSIDYVVTFNLSSGSLITFYANINDKTDTTNLLSRESLKDKAEIYFEKIPLINYGTFTLQDDDINIENNDNFVFKNKSRNEIVEMYLNNSTGKLIAIYISGQ